jgi:hypothetical protein
VPEAGNKEMMMADNKKFRGRADRSKAAKGQGYEVAYFARKHGITAAETRALIAKVGNDRAKLEKAVAGKSKRAKRSKRSAR